MNVIVKLGNENLLERKKDEGGFDVLSSLDHFSDFSIQNREIFKRIIGKKMCDLDESAHRNLSHKQGLLLRDLFLNTGGLKGNVSDKFNENVLPYGFMKGELYTVTGLSGGGKTALCTMISAVLISGNNQNLNNGSIFKQIKVVYVSLEQTKRQIENRIISALSVLNNPERSISFADLTYGSDNVHLEDLRVAITLFDAFAENLTVLDFNEFAGEPSVQEVFDVVKHHIPSNQDTLCIVDRYENLAGATDLQSDTVARELNLYARKLQIPVILQAQMNKASIATAQRKDGSIDSQKLSGNSLRGTSGLEHNSSAILILAPEQGDRQMLGRNLRKIKIVVAKNRYGALTECDFWFDGATNLFLDCESPKRGRPKKIDDKLEKEEVPHDE